VSLDEIYKETILDHYAHPRNKGRLSNSTITVEGANPLCGDEISLYLLVEEGRIQDVRFEGRGCSISQASTSMMTEIIKGKDLSQVRALIDAFKGMMHGKEPDVDLGDLVALQGVRKFPVRIKCATLAWIALQQALDDFEEKGATATRVVEE